MSSIALVTSIVALAPLRVSIGAASVPKSAINPLKNQDAHFALNDGSMACLGVFDGVSAAPRSRAYARKLASSLSAELSRTATCDEAWASQARRCLGTAEKAAGAIRGGASTACVCRIDLDRRTLGSYNLGDSGFMVVSDKGVSARSLPKLHREGMPYQLASRGTLSDKVSAGVTASHTLKAGQYVVVCSDGLTDNMSPADIGEFFAEFAGKMRTKQLARRLAVEAQSRGLKADDISVVVARLYDADEPPTPPTPTPRRR